MESPDDPQPPPPDRPGRPRHRGWLYLSAAVGFALVVALVAASPVPREVTDEVGSQPAGQAAAGAPPTTPTNPVPLSHCPWLEAAMDGQRTPSALAGEVLSRMTLSEKLGETVLVNSGVYENVNAGVPRLCIPALTLQDGPQGLAFGAVHVTQLPAPLGIAATFDTAIARAYGRVQGSEATGQGIDAIQGPTLNIDRIPQNGRSYEGFGEDPTLVSAMGVANIEGIEAGGAMAMAKHFAVYNQEADRGELNDVVSERALQEIYLPPFRAAVTQARVSTVMCAYPQLNGTFQCQDAGLLGLLGQWGFTGFVRSDLGSVHDPVAALAAGTDMIKPSSAVQLAKLVREHRLPMAAVDAAVTRVLTQMFSHGLVGRQDIGSPGSVVDTPSHAAFALTAAERSAVLLKDTHAVLPLDPSRDPSIALIGADAGSHRVATGYGSSRVVAPFTSTPLDAIRRRVGSDATVSFSDGGSTTAPLPAIPPDVLTPASGVGHGLTLTLTQTDPDTGPLSVQSVQPSIDTSIRPHPSISQLLPNSPLPAAASRLRGPLSQAASSALGRAASPTHSSVVLPAGWADVSATWTGTLTPPRSGLYALSLGGSGGANLTLDGAPAVSDMLSHARGRWSQAVRLVGGHAYRVHLDWEPFDKLTPTGESAITPGTLTLGWQYESDRIASAVAAAHKAKVAVVFAGDFNSEAFDRPSLALPGDENALITAVAAANPRTVVVLNTGGPVLMPWLGQVAGVVEDWYPGEQDGAAIAAVLFGDVDPSGRLPVTFPTTDAQAAVNTPAQWPGIDLTATYSEGLGVGYRYDHLLGIQPLFPFGYGLSYTHFSLDRLAVAHTRKGLALTVLVSNQGARSGTDVPQVYLTWPAGAGEPPAQLVAFSPVTLDPGESRLVTLSVPASAFQAFIGGSWTTVPGDYTVAVGESSSDLRLTASLPAP
jgi:beta-glucosidase